MNKNLADTQFPPGKSGNPAGRPKGAKTGLRARLNAKLRATPTADALAILQADGADLEDPDNAAVLAHVLMKKACEGDAQAAKLIADQTERPLPREINLTGGGGEPLDLTWNINIVKAKELDK